MAYPPLNPKKKSRSHYTWRYWLIMSGLSLAAAGLVWRMFDLTVINRAFLVGQGNARTLRVIDVPAYRGIITDRNGEPLAISTPVYSIWINPQEFNPTDQEIAALAGLLEVPIGEIKEKLNKNVNREFAYLKRGISPASSEKIKALLIPGVYQQREYHRFYPEGEVSGHLLGFTNIDDHGQEGLELAYDRWLAGIPGLKRVIKDRLGHVVSEVATLREPKPGRNLTLSIDRRIQYLAYRELKAGIEKYNAISGSVVVLDVKTGEVLAMVNQPSFNPNNRADEHDGRYRNRAITDTFEPGSSIKTFSMVSALASGKYNPNSVVDTSPGWLILEGKRVDDDGHHNGVIDMTTVLKRSSNVGMTKIILSLPPDHLWEMLRKVGFGQLTESSFPGESPGVLIRQNPWHPFSLATLSFGYGMTATLLQLAQAYAILANDGVKRPVSLLKLDKLLPGQQVLDSKVCRNILVMLESVISQGGTAPLARVPGYRVTGKTGTTRIVGPHGYMRDHHNSSFIGVAPASAPRLLVAVYLHDPKMKGTIYYGGYTAGPIFSHIMGGALRLLDIPPDNVNPQVISNQNTAPPVPAQGDDA